jgi:hypothetical protein
MSRDCRQSLADESVEGPAWQHAWAMKEFGERHLANSSLDRETKEAAILPDLWASVARF